MTQLKSILQHLYNKPLTSLVAFNKFGSSTFHRRLSDLKEMGFSIDSHFVYSKNRWGHRNDFKVYSIRKTRSNQKAYEKVFPVKVCK